MDEGGPIDEGARYATGDPEQLGAPQNQQGATLRVRLSNSDEKKLYREQTAARSADAGLPVYLIEIDG